MASLKDIGPLTQTVNVRGIDYEVCGISAGDIFGLFSDFPGLEGMVQTQVKNFNAAQIIRSVPDAVGSIIAIAIARADDRPYDKGEAVIANKLGFADQIKFMRVIFDLTFSEGVGPFVDELRALTEMIRPSTRAQATASLALISAQFVAAGAMKKPGHRRHAN